MLTLRHFLVAVAAVELLRLAPLGLALLAVMEGQVRHLPLLVPPELLTLAVAAVVFVKEVLLLELLREAVELVEMAQQPMVLLVLPILEVGVEVAVKTVLVEALVMAVTVAQAS
jgi:hypothetical protein